MSWSSNRPKGSSGPTKEQKKDALRFLNGELNILAQDEDLHADLRLPAVQIALKHWTGEKRLSPEDAAKVTSNASVQLVFKKIVRLQQICQTYGNMPVPFDHVVQRKRALNDASVARYFGAEFVENQEAKATAKKSSSPSSSSSSLPSTEQAVQPPVKSVLSQKNAATQIARTQKNTETDPGSKASKFDQYLFFFNILVVVVLAVAMVLHAYISRRSGANDAASS